MEVIEVSEEVKKLKLINVSIRKNVVIVNYNNRNSKVNCYSSECNEEVVKVFNFIADNQKMVRGTVVTSSKVDNFFAGVDIKELNSWSPDYAHFISQKGQEVLRSFFHYSKPSVAVVMGSCLGAGFELANSCKYRIAIDTPSTIFGLPEVHLGLIPGATGTVVTPRRHNFKVAVQMMLTGKTYNAKKAKQLGLVDELIPVHHLVHNGPQLCGLSESVTSQDNLSLTLSLLEDIGYSAIEKLEEGIIRQKVLSWSESIFLKGLEYELFRNYIFSQLRREVIKKTNGLYPAPMEILNVLETSFKHGIDHGLAAESAAFKRVFESKQHKSLLQVFNNQMHCKKNHHLVTDSRQLKNGMIKDIANRSRSNSEINSNSLSGTTFMDGITINLITDGVSVDYDELKQLMEAKNMKVVKNDGNVVKNDGKVVKNDGEMVRKDGEVTEVDQKVTIFCSSFVDLSETAAKVGMHFFSALERSPLVEVITNCDEMNEDNRMHENNDLVISQAVQIALNLNKIVITSKNGYYTTRLLIALIIETMDILLCSQLDMDIESMIRIFKKGGFSVDVFRQMDEMGINVVVQIWDYFCHRSKNVGSENTKNNEGQNTESKNFETRNSENLGKSLRDRMISSKTRSFLKKMCNQGLNGIKCSSGWFNYIDARASNGKAFKRAKGVNEEAEKLVQSFKSDSGKSACSLKDKDEILKERLVFSVINEALFCYQQGLISNHIEGDVGAVFGIAFPPLLVGPFHYLQRTGSENLMKQIKRLNESTPFLPPLLSHKFLIDANDSLPKYYP